MASSGDSQLPGTDAASSAASFDAESYWLRRHRELRGDLRAVGHRSKSAQHNRTKYERDRSTLAAVLNRLYPDGAGSRSAIDLACGIGALSQPFVDAGFDYLGVDISPDAIEQARTAHPNASFEVGNIADFRTSRRFDLVLASRVLLHLIDDGKWDAAFDTIALVLKDDGLFVLVNHLPPERPEATARHVVLRSYDEYAGALRLRNLIFDEDLKARIVEQVPVPETVEQFWFVRPQA